MFLLNLIGKLRRLSRSLQVNPLTYVVKSHRVQQNTGTDFVIWGKRKPVRTIFLDVSSLQYYDHGGGIQRTQSSLIHAWSIHKPSNFDISPIYFSKSENRFKKFYVDTKDSDHKLTAISSNEITISQNDVYLNLDLNYDFCIQNPSFFLELNMRGISSFVVIYDLLPILFPRYFPQDVQNLHERWLRIVMKNSYALCISETVSQELRIWAQREFQALECSTFHLGNDFNASNISTLELSRPQNYFEFRFLVVSTIEPRKCHRQILRAFEILWAEDENILLTLVGNQGWDVDEDVSQIVNHPQYGRSLFWYQNISDSRLSQLYYDSSALINASIGEGFGLPIYEAFKHRLPVICRDIPIFREVAGDSAWFFVADIPEDLANCIKNWIKKYRLGEISIPEEPTNTSWRSSCEQLVNIIESISPGTS